MRITRKGKCGGDSKKATRKIKWSGSVKVKETNNWLKLYRIILLLTK
jgi:hypothetical protein